jgi:hypothetical protein
MCELKMTEVESVSGGTVVSPWDAGWTLWYPEAVSFVADVLCTVTGKCTA